MSRVRLQRYLSQSGVAARRKAEELIVAGRVKVNGRVVSELGSTVDAASDQVTVDGEAVHPKELFYVLLNKPKGSITAVSDPEGRPTVMEWLPNLPVPVAPVGRLDFYSEGVLLLTNDGDLSSALQSPKNHVEKTYHVKIRGNMRPAHIEQMRRGVRLDPREGRPTIPGRSSRPMSSSDRPGRPTIPGRSSRPMSSSDRPGRYERVVTTRPAKVDRLKAESKHDWLVITLTEGKSRQIHRMVEALGYQVVKLQRVAFAGLDFHGLRVGDARELTQAEVNRLRDLVGLPRDSRAVARGKWRADREDSDIARRARGKVRDEAEAVAAPAPAAIPRDRARAGERVGKVGGAGGAQRAAGARAALPPREDRRRRSGTTLHERRPGSSTRKPSSNRKRPRR